MRFTNALILAAVGVSAHPSGHAHLHRAIHEKHEAEKRADDAVLVTATIDGKVVSWTQGGSPFKAAHKPTLAAAVVNTPTTTSSSAAAATPTTAKSSSSSPAAAASSSASPAASSSSSSTDSSSGATGSGASTYEAFASCSSSKKNKRATAAEIAYVGNTGCSGYGSNMKLVQSTIADKYTYGVKAVNSASSEMQCVAWNKIGEDGGINGFFSGNQVLTFNIPAGSAQHIVFDTNTQGGMCCQTGSVSLTSVGEFLCPWLEFDFGSSANDGWSGFDASALVAGSVGGPYGALKACTADNSVCSTLYSGGGGSNAYLPGDEALDGVGGNLAPGTVSLIATW